MAGKTTAEEAREADQDQVAAAEIAVAEKDSVEDAATVKAAERDLKNTAAVSEMTAIKAAEALVEKADGKIDASFLMMIMISSPVNLS